VFANAIVAGALGFATIAGGAPAEAIPTVNDVRERTPVDSGLTDAHEAWPLGLSCEHNTSAGPQGWVCTEQDIPANHECLVYVSLAPYRAFVVRDSSVLCEMEAVQESSFQGVAAQIADLHKRAVDGTEVPEDFYSRTDYNRNGIADQDEGFGPNPSVAEVLDKRDTDGSDVPVPGVEYYGGAVCSTDAACSAYIRDHGGEYGDGASPELAIYWDGIPAE
jgi:hypothetical protein